MNDDLFFNNNQNNNNQNNNSNGEPIESNQTASQIYRFKYENGEKAETTRETYQNHNQQNTYQQNSCQNNNYQQDAYQQNSYQNNNRQDSYQQNSYQNNNRQDSYQQNSYQNNNRQDAYQQSSYQSSNCQSNTSYGAYDYSNPYYGTENSTQSTAEPPKKKKRWKKLAKFTAKAACFGVIAGAAFLGVNYLSDRVFHYSVELGGSVDSAEIGSGTQLNITLGTTDTIEGVENPAESVVVQVVDENLAATVAVKSTFLSTYSYWGQQYQKESQGSGSGFIVGINETELLIATNNHVIEDATKIEITFIDDTVAEASIKGTDSIADLAIIAVPLENLSVDTLAKIRVATLGNSDEVRLGEMAIAIGNALGYGQSVTVGYISAKDREVSVDGNTMVLLQTDAAINGGNSGGPLFNTKGEVIGINSVKYADTSVEGMCFAIPISRAIPILNELMNRETLTEEEQGFLGVSTRTVTDDIASFYGWPTGAYIVSVVEGSPAEAANLYIGDIVTSVNGVQIITADQLVSAISSYRYGTTVELKVQRNVNGKYEEITLSVTLAQKSAVMSAAESETTTQNNTTNSDNGSNNANNNNSGTGNNANNNNSGNTNNSGKPNNGKNNSGNGK